MTIEIAEQFEQQEDYEKAYDEYKRLLAKKPNNIDLLQRTANVALILEKKDEASELLSKILSLDPENIMCYEQLMDIYNDTDKYKYYIYRGDKHVVQGQISHAINDFNKALNKADSDEKILSTRFVLGGLYEQVGKFNQAIDEFLRITDHDEATKEAYLKLAKLYEKTDMVSSSVTILEKALEHGFKDDKDVKEALANYYIKNGTPELATEMTSDDLTKIRSYLDNGKDEQALELIKSIEKDYKKNPKYLALVAQYHFQRNEFDEALAIVDEYEKFAKNSPLIYQMRAMIYDELNKNFEASINWAKYNILLDNKDVALNEYMQAYAINNEDAELVYTIANLLDTLNDKTRANEFYEQLVKLEPDNRKALERLADFRESIGDYRQAIEYLEQYHKIDPRNASTIKKLGKFYEKIRKKDKALEYYKKYISISNAVEGYDEIKAKIEKLETQPKNYTETDGEDGLIDIIMRWFNRKK